MSEFITGLEEHPQPLLEHLFSGIAQSEMRTLPFYRPQIPIRACGFQLFEQQWIGALLTPWMLSLLVLPGPGQEWPRRPVGTRLALALPCGNVSFTLGEIDGLPPRESGSDNQGDVSGCAGGNIDNYVLRNSVDYSQGDSGGCGQYLSSSLMSPLPENLTAEQALALAQQCIRMALALPVVDADAPANRGRRSLFTLDRGRPDA